MGKTIDWFSGREARLERVFNEIDSLFQEVIDAVRLNGTVTYMGHDLMY